MKLSKQTSDQTIEKKVSFKTLILIVLAAFLLFLCITYWPLAAKLISGVLGAALPIFIGGVVAYVLNILMTFYERHYFTKSKKKFVNKSRRSVCIVLAFLTAFAIIALVMGLVIPQFINCIKMIITGLPSTINDIVAFLEKHHILTDKTLDYINSVDWQKWVTESIGVLSNGIGNVMNIVITTVSSVFSGTVTFVLSVIFAIYILMGQDKISRQIVRISKRYMPEKWYVRIRYGLSIFDDCFHSFIVGQCIEAVILGVLCIIGMLILGLPYAAMIGALIALTALIPIAGAYIGALVGAFLIFMESPFEAFIFLIFIIVLQQLEGNLIYPKVVGTSIGLPGILVLAAVTIGGGVMGVGGMLLFVPMVAAVYRIIRNDLNNKGPKGDIEPNAD